MLVFESFGIHTLDLETLTVKTIGTVIGKVIVNCHYEYRKTSLRSPWLV